MQIKVLKNGCEQNLKSPEKPGDVGFDMIAKSVKIEGSAIDQGGVKYWRRIDYIEYDTGVVIAPDAGVHAENLPRSSCSNYNLSQCNCVGTVDEGYRGTIRFRFNYLWQPENLRYIKVNLPGACCGQKQDVLVGMIDDGRIYKVGDKVGQLRFRNVIRPEIVVVEKIEETARGDGGFGSTGK